MPKPVCKDTTCACFPHGTAKGRGRGCRCRPCMDAYNLYANRNRLKNALGHKQKHPAGPVIAHVRSLLDGGATVLSISAVSGLHFDAIYGLLREPGRSGHHEHVLTSTRDALMAVTLDAALATVPERSLVDAKRAKQQVRSLMALGWPGYWIAEQCGVTSRQSNLSFVVQDKDKITVDMARRVDDLARRVGDRWGPSERTRKIARTKGWYPPGAYTDEGDLIPWAVRGTEEEEAAKQRKIDVAERRAEVWRLAAEGIPNAEIAARLGISADLVVADKKRGLSRKAERLIAAEQAVA